MNSKFLCRLCRDYFPAADKKKFNGFCSAGCREKFALKELKKLRNKRIDKIKSAAMKKSDDKHREFKRKVNGADKSKATKKAQAAFNAFIRERDKGEPCISCQRHHEGQYHAGHYKTVGAHPELRFCELNCHSQCAPCNNHLSGNIIEYRKNLLRIIGKENLDWLEGYHDQEKRSIEHLNRITAYYKEKIKCNK